MMITDSGLLFGTL